MVSDAERLWHLIEVWQQAAAEAVELLRSLEGADWSRPTDLPGWDVRAVAAHLAHLESDLAGNAQDQVEVPEAAHVSGFMGQFTEAGPVARASWPVSRIIDELESSVAKRYAELTANPPTDAGAPGPGFAGLMGWTWHTLLSNRPLDIWMHEQDIRRATGRPGGLETAAAAHVASVFASSLPFVLGKKVGAVPGATVVLEITGAQRRTLAATVADNGRGTALSEPPAEPTTSITLDFECWVTLAGGRRRPEVVKVAMSGDTALGRRVLENLAVTP